MKRTLIIFLALIPFLSFSQDTLVKWTFPNNPDDSIADGGIAANAGMIISVHGGTNAIAFNVTGASSYSATTTNWVAGNGIKYWQVKFTTAGYQTLLISSKQKSSNTGPRDFKMQYMNGFAGTWADIPGGIVLDSNDWTHGVISNLSLPSACDDQDTVYIRWIMTSDISANGGTIGAAGTSRMDDIIVIGDIITGINTFVAQNDVRLLQNDGNIVLNTKEAAKAIIMYDIIGNLIYRNDKPSVSSLINTFGLNNGLYVIKILFNNNSVITKKISLM